MANAETELKRQDEEFRKRRVEAYRAVIEANPDWDSRDGEWKLKVQRSAGGSWYSDSYSVAELFKLRNVINEFLDSL